MAKRDQKRPIVTLLSTEGTGTTYTTRKNRTNTRERLELRKYDRVLRRVVTFREKR
jgi:large subunit ribosomal protein L33